MKILHVITSLSTGGAEKLMVDLLPRLKVLGHDVDLLLLDGTKTPFRQRIEASGIKVFDLGAGGSVYSPIKLLKLIPYMRDYDVVHTHNTAPQLFAALGSVLCSVVLCTTEHSTSNRRRSWKWYAPIDRWMYSRYRHVICISEGAKSNLVNSVSPFPCATSVICNGIDVHAVASAHTSQLKEKTHGCKTALIQVAGFRYQKDQDTVISAMLSLPEHVHLFLVGDGERRPEIEALVDRLGLNSRVHLLGERSDVSSLLKSADVVVMSSHWEGFGLAAVEGMAAGKPVIASDVDGLREVVKGAGVLFPHQDAEALATEISKLGADPDLYKSVSEACRLRAQQFDISKMAEGYLKIYNSL